MIDHIIIKSRRKTMAIQVKPDLSVIVRAPYGAPDGAVKEFIEKHAAWIEKTLAEMQKRRERTFDLSSLTEQEKEGLREAAKDVFSERLEYYAPLVGVKYGKLSVRMQKARWGSCSRSGNISLNCLLLLAPPRVLDSVIVHELCHIKHMNHSKAFYDEVLRVFPDYYDAHSWLREHGDALLALAE